MALSEKLQKFYGGNSGQKGKTEMMVNGEFPRLCEPALNFPHMVRVFQNFTLKEW